MSIKKRSGQTDAISTAVQNVLFAGDVGNSEFLASLRAFGPLPEDGIRELAEPIGPGPCKRFRTGLSPSFGRAERGTKEMRGHFARPLL